MKPYRELHLFRRRRLLRHHTRLYPKLLNGTFAAGPGARKFPAAGAACVHRSALWK